MDQSNHHTPGEGRGEGRIAIDLEAIIRCREPNGGTWKEMASVTSVSRNGIGLVSPQPCEVGRLVGVVLPMPEELRAFDHAKELYAVHGLVQYCIESDKEYNVGVALIGKKAPDSHSENPAQTYRINGMTKKGFWTVTETEESFKPRRFPRYHIALEVGVSLLQKQTRSVVRNTALTRDVGIGGVAVVSTLEAKIGDKVKFAFEKLDFYAIAVVRNREELDCGEALLRLEFIEGVFPVDKLHLVKNDRVGAKEPVNPEPANDLDVSMTEKYGEIVEAV
jgi:hypothetical protein